MRPFKFFFMVSIAIMAFFFLAKVFIMAFFFAAIMSLVFFTLRGIKNFFLGMGWQDNQYGYQREFAQENRFQHWQQKRETLFNDWDNSFGQKTHERIIKL